MLLVDKLKLKLSSSWGPQLVSHVIHGSLDYSLKQAAMASKHFLFWIFLQVAFLMFVHCSVPSTKEGASFEVRSKLIEYLLSNRSSAKRVRPVKNSTNTLNVTMDLTLSNIIDMDEKYQILTSNVWLRQDEVRQILTVNMWFKQEWMNEIMVWNPEEWGGVEYVSIAAIDVWMPDTVLYNNVFEEFDGRLDNIKTLVRVYHTGRTLWNAPFIFKTLCKIKVKNFPFDRQQCQLKFGSWRFAADEIDIWFREKEGHLRVDKNRIINGEWNVVDVDVKRNAVYFACCPSGVYPDITFIINIQRRPLFYIFNLIIPNFLIALLAFFSFYIPVECGERISFVMTVLLSMFVFLLLIAESIPPTSEAVPAIGVYFTSSIVLVALALVATGFVLKINYMYLHVPGASFSPWTRRLLFRRLGPLLGFKECEMFATKANIQTSCVKRLLENVDKLSLPCKSANDEPGVMLRNGSEHVKREKTFSSNYDESSTEDGSVTFVMGETADTSLRFRGESVTNDIRAIAAAVTSHEEDSTRCAECRLAAAIVDRFFMVLFVLVFVSSTLIILVIPYVSSD